MLKSGAEEWIFLKKLSTFKGPTVRKLNWKELNELNEKKIMKAN